MPLVSISRQEYKGTGPGVLKEVGKKQEEIIREKEIPYSVLLNGLSSCQTQMTIENSHVNIKEI